MGVSARQALQSVLHFSVSRTTKPVTSFITMLRHLGGVGVFILAALDSSVLPTLGAVDALTIVLAARHPEL